jgi:hypothetical protein
LIPDLCQLLRSSGWIEREQKFRCRDIKSSTARSILKYPSARKPVWSWRCPRERAAYRTAISMTKSELRSEVRGAPRTAIGHHCGVSSRSCPFTESHFCKIGRGEIDHAMGRARALLRCHENDLANQRLSGRPNHPLGVHSQSVD